MSRICGHRLVVVGTAAMVMQKRHRVHFDLHSQGYQFLYCTDSREFASFHMLKASLMSYHLSLCFQLFCSGQGSGRETYSPRRLDWNGLVCVCCGEMSLIRRFCKRMKNRFFEMRLHIRRKPVASGSVWCA